MRLVVAGVGGNTKLRLGRQKLWTCWTRTHTFGHACYLFPFRDFMVIREIKFS